MEDNDQSHSINPHSMNPDKLDIDNDLDLLDTDVPKLSHEPLPALHALSLTEDVHKRDPPSQPRAYEPRAHAQPKGRFRFRRYYDWDRRTPRKASSIDQQKQDEDTEMADVENRRDYRGGGGGHRGGGYNKKRRFREDDDYDQRDRQVRHRPAPGTQLRNQLTSIADSPLSNPQEDAANTAKLVVENYEDEYVKETFCQVVLKLVVEQPFKIPFVAAVVRHVNHGNPDAAKEILTRTGAQVQELLNAGKWRDFKLVLRFLACLSPLYEEDGVLPILDELFDRAVDLQSASSEDVVGLELVKIILLTVPYLLASADDSLQSRVAELLEKTEIVATTPHALEPLVDPYPTNNEDEEKPMPFGSLISLLQRQLQAEGNDGWKLTVIPRAYTSPADAVMPDSGANGNGEVSKATKHAFPAITVPSPVNPGPKALFPETYFSVYEGQTMETIPPTTSIASSLIRDAVVDTVNILDFNRNTTAKLLNDLDCSWAPDIFVKRGTTFDKLKEVPEGKSTWKPEDVVVDAIFSQIFQLPAPEHKLVYYHSVITEICKLSPAAVAPSLGRAIRFLFRNVEVMDMELEYRFMDWFAHHLSNFEFRWKWLEWLEYLELSNLHPKKAFISGVFEKEIRLSFAKRIRDTLPAEYNPITLITENKEKDVPDFKYADDQTPYAKEGREVLALLRKKSPTVEDDIQNVLNQVHEQATALGVGDPLVPSTDIYMTAICFIGAKSLSHVLSTVDRCKDRLLAIGPQSELARRQIVSSVFAYWADQPGTAVNIVDKLLNYNIVTPMCVIEWALHDHLDRGRALASPQIYEMVSSTMFKVTNRVRQVVGMRNTAEQNEARKQADAALPQERQAMRDLFSAIQDAVEAVGNGAQDEMIERFDGESVERDLIVAWGERWTRVWRRKAAVEEATVGEGAVGPLELNDEQVNDGELENSGGPDNNGDLDIDDIS